MEASFDNSTVLELEVEAPALSTRSFWDVASFIDPNSSSSSNKIAPELKEAETGGKTVESSNNINIVYAVFFFLLALVLGFVLLR